MSNCIENCLPKFQPIQVLNDNRHYSTWQTAKQLENDVYRLSKARIQVESFQSGQ